MEVILINNNALKELDTPQVVVDKSKLLRNIQDMQNFADKTGVRLRPHIKSHKITEIAELQINKGAAGVTVSKLGEAEVMIDSGIKDVFIAYEIVGEKKVKRLLELTKKAQISVAVDSLEGAAQLNEAAWGRKRVLDVLLEIDTGLNRCGVLPDQKAVELAREIKQMTNLNFKGIFTHVGQVYGSRDRNHVEATARHEGHAMSSLRTKFEKEGINLEVVSVGSTPTVKISGKYHGITEIRPGNYVFYDAIQVGLGVAEPNLCSITVLATVISVPSQSRAVIDAGSKTLALDTGAHGTSIVKGFGIIKGYENLTITRLSEEHGIIEGAGVGKQLNVGDVVEIIPNHACPVINLTDEVAVIEHGKLQGYWKVKARGKNK